MKFAVVSAWPDLKNAEYEVIERIKISAKNIGAECIVIDNEGFVIGKDDKRTGEYFSGGEVEFAIALHFTSEKLYNIYTYGAMWNPPKFLMDFGYEQESKKFFTYDDYLVYGSNKIEAHLDNLLTQTDKDITNCLQFMTSVPGKPIPPKLLDNIKLFYSGINWERMSNSKGRHHDFFKALDDEGLTCIYGPEKFFDAIPWEGFSTYSGSLPFDGISSMKAISDCGASLVMTSNEHRKVEAVSSRLFESCAAGVVLICDDNPFVMREFGDSVLYITYDELDYKKNVDQIKEHLKWIENNKEDALELAQRSQKIYKEKYHLDTVLDELVTKHATRKAEVIKQTCDVETGVSVILRILQVSEELEKTLQSLNTQYNKAFIELIIVCDETDSINIETQVEKHLNKDFKVKIIKQKIFKEDKRLITTGCMLSIALESASFEYVSVVSQDRVFFEDHFSLCCKQLQESNVSMVYTANCVDNRLEDGSIKRHSAPFSNYHISDIVNFSEYIDISMLMFKKSTMLKYHKHLKLPDGREAHSIMIASYLVGDWKFSYKTTFTVNVDSCDKTNHLDNIVEDSWQLQYIKDAFKYNQLLANITKNNVRRIDLSIVDLNQFEALLKNFLKAKIGKYPRLLSFVKKIYNKRT